MNAFVQNRQLMRLVCFAAAIATLLMSVGCTRAVDIPVAQVAPSEGKTTYKITTTAGRELVTRDLTIDGDKFMFSSDGKQYLLSQREIARIERLEVDKTRTTITAVAIVTVAGLAVYLFTKFFIEGLPGTE